MKRQKDARIQWLRNHINWTDEWLTVLFSVLENYSFDGPYGWAYYWHDIRKESLTFFSKHKKDSRLVWGSNKRYCSFERFEDCEKDIEELLLQFEKLVEMWGQTELPARQLLH